MKKAPDGGNGRLMKPFGVSSRDNSMDTMTSMRNVDSSVPSKILVK